VRKSDVVVEGVLGNTNPSAVCGGPNDQECRGFLETPTHQLCAGVQTIRQTAPSTKLCLAAALHYTPPKKQGSTATTYRRIDFGTAFTGIARLPPETNPSSSSLLMLGFEVEEIEYARLCLIVPPPGVVCVVLDTTCSPHSHKLSGYLQCYDVIKSGGHGKTLGARRGNAVGPHACWLQVQQMWETSASGQWMRFENGHVPHQRR
jgi:hypothetical protein